MDLRFAEIFAGDELGWQPSVFLSRYKDYEAMDKKTKLTVGGGGFKMLGYYLFGDQVFGRRHCFEKTLLDRIIDRNVRIDCM